MQRERRRQEPRSSSRPLRSSASASQSAWTKRHDGSKGGAPKRRASETLNGASRAEVLRLAGAVEDASEHPVARAVAAEDRGPVLGIDSGERAVPQDDAEALKWVRLSAEQGVAMAQNWIIDRGIVLMDEPFSALDALTRRELHRTRLYNLAMKPLGIEDTLGVRLRIGPPRQPKQFVFERGGRGFSARGGVAG